MSTVLLASLLASGAFNASNYISDIPIGSVFIVAPGMEVEVRKENRQFLEKEKKRKKTERQRKEENTERSIKEK